MLTCCPSCATHFRVTPAQLKARAGTVRCGQCNFVFNALETLLDEPPSPPAEISPMPTSREETGDVFDIWIGEAETWTDNKVVEPARKHAAKTDAQPEVYPAEPLQDEATAKVRRWPWALGSMIAVLGLLTQATYYYRVELAVLRPDWRSALQAACKPLHCEVPRPRSIDTLGIDTSDLHPEPQHPGHLTLTATLRSKAAYAQEWPLLELTLTDVADHTLAVKHFAAGDYLPRDKDKGQPIEAGFPANGEIAVALPLDVGDLPAVGYRLYVFYP
ncbi:conserved protein of unknown function [Georgfuchsia toluolica]|uniref:Zinc finger/thioredoxin putative domain-containing protein n=1 Tax=Georgfuchsia toluolica TaxID=424218 RepID=A0A916N377_9PROT|nr:DUF3426 domain-containing protein [Georgfuchsia toluolica]CAG4884694.1 conserved protein of unknown function [Georgfuchsia toluolica]